MYQPVISTLYTWFVRVYWYRSSRLTYGKYKYWRFRTVILVKTRSHERFFQKPVCGIIQLPKLLATRANRTIAYALDFSGKRDVYGCPRGLSRRLFVICCRNGGSTIAKVRSWLQRRNSKCVYHNLSQELRLEDECGKLLRRQTYVNNDDVTDISNWISV